MSITHTFSRTATATAVLLALHASPAWAQAGDSSLPAVVVSGSTESDGYTSKVTVGGKEERELREIPNSVTVITRQRIEEQNLSTVTEVLNQTTGVTAISNDTTQSQFYSRGYALGVAYDGIPARTGLSGYQQLDLPVYERVEVLRGPAGVLQGSDEPGGVVNLVRKRAKADFAVTGSVGTGSWNNHRAEIDITGALNADRTLRARGVLAATDRDYFYDNAHTRKWLGYGTVEWDVTRDTTLSLILTSQDDRTTAPYSGLPSSTTGSLLDAPRSINPTTPWSVYEWSTQDLAAELEHRFNDDWKAKVKLARRDQTFFFKDGYATTGVDPLTQTLDYARRIRDVAYQRDSADLFVTGKVSLLGRKHDVLAGYNYDSFTTANIGVTGTAVTGVPFGRSDLVPDFNVAYNSGTESQVRQSGFYGQVRLHVTEPLKVLLGGRYSDFESRNRNIAPSTPTAWTVNANKANSQFTPYAGAVYDLAPNLSLYGSYSSIFVPQAQNKLGGGTLDPREGRQIEVGAKGAFFNGGLNASIAVFNLRDTNRAFQVGTTTDYLNAGEVESKGWEVEFSGSPAPGYHLQAGYSRQDTIYLTDKNNQGLPFQNWQPRHTLKAWATRRFGEGALSGLTVGLGATVASENRSGSTGTAVLRRQGGYAVVNALASYAIDKRTSVSFNVNNLFDRTYYTRLGGTNTYNTYGDPRNVSVTLRTRF